MVRRLAPAAKSPKKIEWEEPTKNSAQIIDFADPKSRNIPTHLWTRSSEFVNPVDGLSVKKSPSHLWSHSSEFLNENSHPGGKKSPAFLHLD